MFPEPDPLRQQFETMRILGEHTDVPVPRMRWAESDTSVIGRTFFVMDRLTGEVAGDAPPYTVEGYVMDMDVSSRRAWHRNGIGAMARVHAVDWRALGLDYLDQPHHGATGPEQRHNYLDHYRTGRCATGRIRSSTRRGRGSTPTGPTTVSTSSCAGATHGRAT